MIPVNSSNSSNLLHALEDLDQGVVSHTKWLKGLHRSIICCDERPNREDIGPEAHRNCRFGKWFYTARHKELDGLELFAKIGEQHKNMHNQARTLLVKGLSEDCNQAAIKAVKQWEYEPAYQHDKPMEVWWGQFVEFSLQD